MLDEYGNIIPENTENNTTAAPAPEASAPAPAPVYTPEPAATAIPPVAEPPTASVPTPVYAPAADVAPVPAPVQAFADAPSPELFYRETIKNETRKRDNGKFRRVLAIALAASLVGGSAIGLGIGIGVPVANEYIIPRLMDDREEVDAFRFDNQATAQTVGAFDGESVGYAALVASAEPSVVNITASVAREQSFGGFIIPQDMPVQVAGSGILFLETDTKYYVVTNNHVITGAQQVYVSIEGSEGIPAAPVGGDAANDLAVISILKTDAVKAGVKSAKIAVFGDSDAMRVGDAVLAIGNALGEGNTATNGIVSAPVKEIDVQGTRLTLLQTNAAINEGNSGGPLLNMNGEVIGINTVKLSAGSANSASVEGMGYAIPSNIVKPIIEGFLQSKPMLGVQINDISPEMAQQFNLPQAGVIILGLVDGSPAEKAGLRVNDIVTGVNDAPVLTSQQLIDTVQQYKIGDTVNVKIIREGTEFLTIPVKLAEREVSTF